MIRSILGKDYREADYADVESEKSFGDEHLNVKSKKKKRHKLQNSGFGRTSFNKKCR